MSVFWSHVGQLGTASGIEPSEIDTTDLRPGAIYLRTDIPAVYAWDGEDWLWLTEDYVCVRDKKAAGTNGGTFTSGAWRTRDINDEQADAAEICDINGNQITLAAGTYRCLISAPAFAVNRHQIRLYNITDGVVVKDMLGTSEHARSTAITATRSFIVGRFVLSAQKVLEIQHRCETTRVDDGFGNRSTFTDEFYSIAEFWRRG